MTNRSLLDRLDLDFPPDNDEAEPVAPVNRGPSNKHERDSAGRFQKGHSLPGPGRPKGTKSLRTLIREKGDVIVEDDPQKRTFAELAVERLWMQAINGSIPAIKMIIDISDGPFQPPEPPPSPVEVYSVSFEAAP